LKFSLLFYIGVSLILGGKIIKKEQIKFVVTKNHAKFEDKSLLKRQEMMKNHLQDC